jgi:hypothetical protein
VVETLEALAQHPELADIVAGDLERWPYSIVNDGIVSSYASRVRSTHQSLVAYLAVRANAAA